jgi:hypothetical protein
MMKSRKNLAVNVCIAGISCIISFTIGYYIYSNMRKLREKTVGMNIDDDYQVSLFNHEGRRLSETSGPFRLITDPFTIFNNYPNQKSKSYSINKYRFRDGHTSDKPYTAMVVGGSAAFGWHVNDNEKTFSSQLSRINPKYNIINGAVVAFLSGQELAQMIHYLDDFHPNLYIVFNGWNDVSDPYLVTQNWPATYTSFGFYHFFSDIENRLAEYYKLTSNDINSQTSPLEPIGKPLDEQDYSQLILKRYTTNVKKMYSFASSRNAKFLLVFQPELTSKRVLSEDEKKFLTASNQRPYTYLDKNISKIYKNLIEESKKIFDYSNIAFIDINDEPEFCEKDETLFYDVVHPNVQGHEIIAKILQRVLMEKF